MTRYYVVSLVLQLAHVLGAEASPAVGAYAGLFGVGIPLVVGVWLGATEGRGAGPSARSGFLVGLIPALLGLLLAVALGHVEPFLLVAGSLSSGVAGALGGAIGAALGRRGARARA